MAIALSPFEDADGSNAIVWIRVKIAGEFHIYGKIEKKSPYRSLEVELGLPDGVQPSGEWEYPSPETLKGHPVYFETVTLKRPLKVTQQPTTVTATVRFQACNEDVCLPPTSIKLTTELAPAS